MKLAPDTIASTGPRSRERGRSTLVPTAIAKAASVVLRAAIANQPGCSVVNHHLRRRSLSICGLHRASGGGAFRVTPPLASQDVKELKKQNTERPSSCTAAPSP